MRIALGVVAHHARADQAHALQESIGAQYLHMDNGSVGCDRSHRKAWSYLSGKDTDFSVVVEDDCIPVEGFRDQIEQALAAAPAPIVSLYLGTGQPAKWQTRIGKSVQSADDKDANWIVGKHLFHAVGVAIRTDLLATVKLDTRLPIDQAWTKWRRSEHLDVAYTWPSLVDHRDEPTVFDHKDGPSRSKPRKAWRTGTHEHWTGTYVGIC